MNVRAAQTLDNGKAAFRKALFSLSRIDRIHIIGCSRSGTTMLHLAMVCFENVTLSEFETGAGYPYLAERIKLALSLGWRPGRKFYITKRGPGWYLPHKIDILLAQTRLENIGIIHLVRDPRDVMLSKHGGSTEKPDSAYVSHEHWYRSIAAADRVFESLADHKRKLVLRYEDLVLDPAGTQQRIAATFGLKANPAALPIDRVKDNFANLNIRFDSDELKALNGLRNMDSRSIGRWRQGGIAPIVGTMEPSMRARFEAFCAEHRYE